MVLSTLYSTLSQRKVFGVLQRKWVLRRKKGAKMKKIELLIETRYPRKMDLVIFGQKYVAQRGEYVK